jgi:hypothetical protein
MNCLLSLERWGRGFEFHSRHGFVCVVLCLGRALRLADHSSKDCYRLCKKDYGTEEEARAQQRALEPLVNKWMNVWIRNLNCNKNHFTRGGVWWPTSVMNDRRPRILWGKPTINGFYIINCWRHVLMVWITYSDGEWCLEMVSSLAQNQRLSQ